MPNYRKTQEAISRLSPEQYHVTQQNGTEPPGTGELLDNKEPGIYVDIVSKQLDRDDNGPSGDDPAPARRRRRDPDLDRGR
jgi:SelR domain